MKRWLDQPVTKAHLVGLYVGYLLSRIVDVSTFIDMI